MTNQHIQKEIADALIVCAGRVSDSHVTIFTASKQDAESLYSAVDTVAEDDSRELDKTDRQGLHREYYIELAESDEHSIGDDEDFDWNTRPVWTLTFQPTSYFQQRMRHWLDDDYGKSAPTDFSMTPVIARVIYYAGAYEMVGKNGEAYIEVDMVDSDVVSRELDDLGIDSMNVDDLWRFDAESSKTFREYAGVPDPAPAVDTEER